MFFQKGTNTLLSRVTLCFHDTLGVRPGFINYGKNGLFVEISTSTRDVLIFELEFVT